MPTTPPTITPLPTPPDPNDRSTFNARAYPWSVAQQTLATEQGAVATNVYNNAVEVASNAAAAADAVTDADAAAASAAASAASAIGAPGTNANSTTSLTLTAGSKSWTIQTGKLFAPGQPIYLASASDPTKRMTGILLTHNSGTGACNATLTPDPGASGTFADWIMGLGVSTASVVSLPRIARTSNIALTVAEKGKLIDVTSGTFTQTTDSAATLTADWFAYLTNTGTGVVTFGTLALVQGAMVKLQSDGTTVRAYPERLPEQVLVAREEQTSGTQGGTPGGTSTWLTRVLNTAPVNTISGASVASNQITLPAGTYHIAASAPGYRVNSHQARLYNVTAASAVIVGSSEFCTNDTTTPSQTRSVIDGVFTLASSSALRIEHYVQNAFAGNGFGRSVSTGASEVYTIATIRRIA